MRGTIERIVEPALVHVGLAENRDRRAALRFETVLPSRRASPAGCRAISLPCTSPVGESCRQRGDHADDHADAHEDAAVRFDRGRTADKTRRPRPSRSSRSAPRRAWCARIARAPSGFSSSPQKLASRIFAVGSERVADGMLHPRIGGDDEVSGKPRAEKHQKRGEPVAASARAFSRRTETAREKLDSRKNEKTPSIASVWPITPPAERENAAQLVPN